MAAMMPQAIISIRSRAEGMTQPRNRKAREGWASPSHAPEPKISDRRIAPARKTAFPQKAKAEAERAKAEAEKAKAEVQARRAKQGSRHVGRRAPPPPSAASWQRIARNVSSVVGGLGLVGGGVMHGLSYYWAKEKVGDGLQTVEDGVSVYGGSQRDAKLAHDLRTWALVGYAVGGAGVIAATVFKILEPESSLAEVVVPTANGLAVVF